MKITSFAEANTYLAQFYDNTRTVYALDTMHQLMDILDNPQEKFKAIHVAGTSGKSSTAYYAAALLTAAGYKTGLTISPHVDEINERLQINMKLASEAVFCEALSKFSDILAKTTITPSWFEAMVAFMYWYFAREGVEYAVIEVGLGGLLDGTNVIKRADKVCVITDIGLDHTKILGSTIPEIVVQKAGIIQQGNLVFIYDQGLEVVEIVRQRAKAMNAHLTVMQKGKTDFAELPVFQQRNYALAYATVTQVLLRDKRSELTLTQQDQAAHSHIPGRMETLLVGNKTVILDGAHNAQKLQALKNALHVKYPHKKLSILMGFVEGDEARLSEALSVLNGMASFYMVTAFISAKDYIKRSVDPAVIAAEAQFKVTIVSDPAEAADRILARPEDIVVVTGSFYLLNHIRPLMLKG